MKLRKYELKLLLISLDKSIKMTEYEVKRLPIEAPETKEIGQGLLKDLKEIRTKVQHEIKTVRKESLG